MLLHNAAMDPCRTLDQRVRLFCAALRALEALDCQRQLRLLEHSQAPLQPVVHRPSAPSMQPCAWAEDTVHVIVPV